jgi:hypothetical protein
MMVHRDTAARGGGPSGAAMSFVGARGVTPPPPGVQMSAAGPMPVADAAPLWANEPITVGDNGATGVVITLNRAAVRGRPRPVGWRGSATTRANAESCERHPAAGLVPRSHGVRGWNGHWTFLAGCDVSRVWRGTGKYIVTSNALPGYPTLKSVTVGGLDITDMALEVGEKNIAEIVITYVDTPMASLTIVAGPPTAVSANTEDKTVLVFPTDRKLWTEPAAGRRRYRTLPLTSQGTMTTRKCGWRLLRGRRIRIGCGRLDGSDQTRSAVAARPAQSPFPTPVPLALRCVDEAPMVRVVHDARSVHGCRVAASCGAPNTAPADARHSSARDCGADDCRHRRPRWRRHER